MATGLDEIIVIIGSKIVMTSPSECATLGVDHSPHRAVAISASAGDIGLVGSRGYVWAVTSQTDFSSVTGVVQSPLCT